MAEKVLLVDDEKEFVEALGERLTSRGMVVSTLTSAKDAVQKVNLEAYDAIILDLQMPEMDGLEVLAAIKKIKPEMQVILLTGHGTVKKSVEAMKLGAMDFLEKPADIENLTEIIKTAHVRKMIIVEKEAEEDIKKIITRKGW